MDTEFKPGDVVRLKSGGPQMTVEKVASWNGAMTADCSWFSDNKLQSGSFPLTSLKHVEG
jgi:uncharacterized protein YodC (DUF2158 family)